MRNLYGDQITENMIVRLRAGVARKSARRESAQVIGWIPDIEGGVRLSERLDGFYSWNVDDLEPVPRQNA